MFQCQVSADNSLDNLQGSNSIFRSVWLDKKCVSIGLRQLHLASMPRCIKNAHSALALEPGRDLGAETSACQANIQNRKVRLVSFAQFDCLVDGAGDAANVVPTIHQHLFEHVSHIEII